MTDRASLCTVHEMSGLPIRSRYKLFLRQFVSKHRIILPLIQAPSFFIDDHPHKDLKVSAAALSFCSPVGGIFQRMFEHVLPYRRTMQPSLA